MMEAGSQTRIDVRLNEWSFDEQSAGFMLREDDAFVVYLWRRGVVPSILEDKPRAEIEERDPIYVYHEDVFDAEGIDPEKATCFGGDGERVLIFAPGPVPEHEVTRILGQIDPAFHKYDGGEEWDFKG